MTDSPDRGWGCTSPGEDPALHTYVVRFDAGAHTAWQRHVFGQLLIFVSGTGFGG
jgi:quercetin dioxygenase-like cupin family protein